MPKWISGTLSLVIERGNGTKTTISLGYSLSLFLIGLYFDEEDDDFRVYLGTFFLMIVGE